MRYSVFQVNRESDKSGFNSDVVIREIVKKEISVLFFFSSFILFACCQNGVKVSDEEEEWVEEWESIWLREK